MHTARPRTMIAGAASTAAAIALAVSLAVDPPCAEATQEYAKRESKECAFCHVNSKGAGPRNAQGREFEANGHKFGVKSWTSEATQSKYLRACAAVGVQWYAEAARLLAEVAAEEKLPGGLALAQATTERFRMFPRTWLGAAKKLLAQGDRGRPNAFAFLAKLESQFPASDEGKEATKQLDASERDDAKKSVVTEARAFERVRVVLLRGKAEWDIGNADIARRLFEEVLADPKGKTFEKQIQDVLSPPPPAK